MDSRNRMDCSERIRTSAANSHEKWVDAGGPTTVAINYDEYKIKVNHKEPGSDPKITENRGLESNLA